jgi:hypothetical protein
MTSGCRDWQLPLQQGGKKGDKNASAVLCRLGQPMGTSINASFAPTTVYKRSATGIAPIAVASAFNTAVRRRI